MARRAGRDYGPSWAAVVFFGAVLVALVLALSWLASLGGCSSIARQSMSPAPSALSSQPAEVGQAAQQSGQGNVAAPISAPNWTGINYSTALPWGQVGLVGVMVVLMHRQTRLGASEIIGSLTDTLALMRSLAWYSHEREVKRIDRNGRRGGDGSGE